MERDREKPGAGFATIMFPQEDLLLLPDNGELFDDSFVLFLLGLVIFEKKFLVTILKKERSNDSMVFSCLRERGKERDLF